MLKVAIIDEELPYPANSGKRLRSLNLITRLARIIPSPTSRTLVDNPRRIATPKSF